MTAQQESVVFERFVTLALKISRRPTDYEAVADLCALARSVAEVFA